MSFEMQVVSNTPLIGEEDLEVATKKFFEQIGYLSKGSDPTIPYKIFTDFFLKHPTKAWYVDEIVTELKTSKPTVYRHLNKLKGFDILEEVQVFDDSTKQNRWNQEGKCSRRLPSRRHLLGFDENILLYPLCHLQLYRTGCWVLPHKVCLRIPLL